MAGWFEGKGVLVTGGASGIGAAAAQCFAREGAKVAVADLNLDGAERIAALIRGNGGEAFALKVDIAKPEDNERMVDDTVARFGRLDVAFLNAGFVGTYTGGLEPGFDAIDLAAFDRIVGINLRGTFLGLKAVKRVIQPGGAVVCTSSSGGLFGLPDNPAYSASKHGVLGLVKSAAAAFAKKGARVTAICPGGVNTPMNGLPQSDDITAPDAIKNPEYRGFVDSQHIAEWAVFLANPRSSGMTGGFVQIDSGSMFSFPPSA